jgi:hypothetical protein
LIVPLVAIESVSDDVVEYLSPEKPLLPLVPLLPLLPLVPLLPDKVPRGVVA